MELHKKGGGYCVHLNNGDKVTLVQRYEGDAKVWTTGRKFAPNSTEGDAQAALAWALPQITAGQGA